MNYLNTKIPRNMSLVKPTIYLNLQICMKISFQFF